MKYRMRQIIVAGIALVLAFGSFICAVLSFEVDYLTRGVHPGLELSNWITAVLTVIFVLFSIACVVGILIDWMDEANKQEQE